MESVHALKGNNLIVRYLEDVKHKLQLREMSSGKVLKTYDIPIGSISHLSCRREDSDFFFKLTSFTNPGIAYHCQLENKSEPYILHRTVVESIHEDDFVTTQVGGGEGGEIKEGMLRRAYDLALFPLKAERGTLLF